MTALAAGAGPPENTMATRRMWSPFFGEPRFADMGCSVPSLWTGRSHLAVWHVNSFPNSGRRERGVQPRGDATRRGPFLGERVHADPGCLPEEMGGGRTRQEPDTRGKRANAFA